MNGFAMVGGLAYELGKTAIGDTPHFIMIWFLAIVFAVSGFAKLRSPVLAAMAIADFGVLRRVRPAFGVGLGISEIALAAALSSAAAGFVQSRIPVVIAVLALWLFTVLIMHSLLIGRRFSCFCFGNTDDGLSHITLLRTAALALLATCMAMLPEVPLYSANTVIAAFPAVALLETAALTGYIPRLLTWNRSPIKISLKV